MIRSLFILLAVLIPFIIGISCKLAYCQLQNERLTSALYNMACDKSKLENENAAHKRHIDVQSSQIIELNERVKFQNAIIEHEFKNNPDGKLL